MPPRLGKPAFQTRTANVSLHLLPLSDPEHREGPQETRPGKTLLAPQPWAKSRRHVMEPQSHRGTWKCWTWATSPLAVKKWK